MHNENMFLNSTSISSHRVKFNFDNLAAAELSTLVTLFLFDYHDL